MAQNITLMGASYSDVPAVELPKTGGGTATFTDVTPTTATDSDVASGKVYFKADGSQSTGTASGGGGASNVVTGTFTGTTTGKEMSITLNYAGTGYPLAITIYPTEGAYNPNGTFYSLIQRYASVYYCCIKTIAGNAPTWSGTSSNYNKMSVVNRYKNSTTNSTTLGSTTANAEAMLSETYGLSSSGTTIVSMPSSTKLKVYIASASYGFAANIEYTYHIIYSS